MITLTSVDKDKPPKPTKFLKRQPMCGLCKFKCCNSPSLKVECTPEESTRLELPIVFPQNGACRELTDKGCKHGDARPVFCRMFPAQLQKGSLIQSHWSLLNCPHPTDYIEKDGAYHLRDDVSGAKRNNSLPVIEQDISDFPTIVETCADAITEIWGADYLQTLRNYVKPKETLWGST